MLDRNGRSIEYVRLSITDRCNLRCRYCMPESGVTSLRHEELLTFEEIVRIVKQLPPLGIHAVRLTGGEPMVRRDCMELIRMLHDLEGIDRIAMTTNGILLKGRVAEAKEAGLQAVNISLDTLDKEQYAYITRRGRLEEVMKTIEEAIEAGLKVELNVVPLKGINEDCLCEVARLAKKAPVAVRFIELMPIGCARTLEPVPLDQVRSRMNQAFGELREDTATHGLGPATYVKPPGFIGSLGFIGAITHEFCGSCNRIRITPEGKLKLCLNHQPAMDLREMLRHGCEDSELREKIRETIWNKPLHHGFLEKLPDREERRMNQIGG